ncbi:MAG: protein YgfX [Pontibacterium sp.]
MFSPLNIPLSFDHRITCVYGGVVIVALLSLQFLNLPFNFRAITMLSVVLLALVHYVHWYRTIRAMTALEWYPRQKRLVVTYKGEKMAVNGIVAKVKLPYCIFLRVKLISGQQLSLVITKHSTTADGYRRLRVYVNHALPIPCSDI